MFYKLLFYLLTIMLLSTNLIYGWDSDDLSLFDIVEEVNQNFYKLLDIDQSATSNEIKKAYRKLSLQLHPDKNKDPNSEVQFRNLVSVYEVLKDENLRNKYNEILINGLPDWRQPVFYYRSVRKMGLIELSILMTIILTVGHYLVMWSSYFEKRFELEEFFRSKKKKDKKIKKNKSKIQCNDEDLNIKDKIMNEECEKIITKPKAMDLFPFLIARGIIFIIKQLPSFIKSLLEKKENISSLDEDLEEEFSRPKRQRLINTPFVYELAEAPESLKSKLDYTENSITQNSFEFNTKLDEKKGEWSEEEFELLIKSVVKYPGGITNRWEKIANVLNRPVKEVITKSRQLNEGPPASGMGDNINKFVMKTNKDFLKNCEVTLVENNLYPCQEKRLKKDTKPDKINCYKSIERTLMISNPKTNDSVLKPTNNESKVSFNKKIDSYLEVTNWSQQHQKLLEAALIQVPKDALERWVKVSQLVPGKTKEECLQRVKYLAELVKKKKEKLNPSFASLKDLPVE